MLRALVRDFVECASIWVCPVVVLWLAKGCRFLEGRLRGQWLLRASYQGCRLSVWLLPGHLASGVFAKLLHHQVNFSFFSVPMGRNSECRTHQGLGKTVYSLIWNSSPGDTSPGDVPTDVEVLLPGHMSPCPLFPLPSWLWTVAPSAGTQREESDHTSCAPSWLTTMCNVNKK